MPAAGMIYAVGDNTQANKIACMSLIENYQGSASVETQKQYAKCVGVLHPDTMDSCGIVAVMLAVLAVVFFVGFISTFRR